MSWLGSDWDRGYRAGREEGLKEMRKLLRDALIARAAESKLSLDQQFLVEKVIEEETSWLD